MSSSNSPFPVSQTGIIFQRYYWPVSWIARTGNDAPPFVHGFRLVIDQPADASVRFHVSADERYELYLDGERVASGPERGSPESWYFDTLELSIKAGRHVMFARVWALGEKSPYAQMTVRPGFLLGVEDKAQSARWSTGIAAWEAKRIDGYEWVDCPSIPFDGFTGKKIRLTGNDYPWGVEQGKGDGWAKAVVSEKAATPNPTDLSPIRLLTPGTLPPMLRRPAAIGVVRFAEEVSRVDNILARPVDPKNHLPEIAARFQAVLDREASFTFLHQTRYRIIIDLKNYFCAFPQLRVSKGCGGQATLNWAEALFVNPPSAGSLAKGNRHEIDGKYFLGHGDTFLFDGGAQREYSTLWWQAGRYVELLIETQIEDLVLERLDFIETRYPLEAESSFSADDPRLGELAPVLLRSLQMNAHETFMDCPYYEQLNYTGDTLIDCLTIYTHTSDVRLPRKSLQLFHDSRMPQGITQSRFPCRVRQVIPTFSLLWISMLRNHAWWRGEPDFVSSLLPGARAVIDAHLAHLTPDGLLANLNGWNFLDWVEGWEAGAPPDADQGEVSGPLNLLFIYALQAMTELEIFTGEPELAARYSRHAQSQARLAEATFWNEERGLFADDRAHRHFSEHAQCLAILGGKFGDSHVARATQGLLQAPDLQRCTIYFSHYLFETLHLVNRAEPFFARLEDWLKLPAQGFVTTPEQPEPSRSDCHAWGCHPLFHYFATILGIRPSAMGFAEVSIRPQLGPLQNIEGQMVHPRGWITVRLCRAGNRLEGEIALPEGVTGIFQGREGQQPLQPGRQTISA